MKKTLLLLIVVSFLQFLHGISRTQPIHSSDQLTLFEQLCIVNEEWKNQDICDPSYFKSIDHLPEDVLIRTHLQLVEKHLRNKDVSDLSVEKQANRKKYLDLLHDYWSSGIFPRNSDFTDRTPYFIDKDDRICAVGYLVHEGGNRGVALQVTQSFNNAYIKDMELPELNNWVENSGLTLEECAWIQPQYCGMVTEFYHVPKKPIATTTVQFYDSTFGLIPNAWHWDFGDGTTDTIQNPTHIYLLPGTYLIELISSNSNPWCYNFEYDTITIYPRPKPKTNFSYQDSAHRVKFNDLTVDPISWDWDFGDGYGSYLQDPVHNYTNAGTYLVTLISANKFFSDTTAKYVSVKCGGLVSSFSVSTHNLTATFQNQSLKATSYQWDFGDGFISNDTNLIHHYATNGTYKVDLIAYNACFSTTFIMMVNVTCTIPQAGFSYWNFDTQVYFIDKTNNADSMYWDFGDGQTSSQRIPVHQYKEQGRYDVCLRASNSCAYQDYCRLLDLCKDLPKSKFKYTIEGLNVHFMNVSDHGKIWNWDFGDGMKVSEQDPIHKYSEPGIYTVCLNAENNCGVDEYCSDILLLHSSIKETDLASGLSVYPNPFNVSTTLIISSNKSIDPSSVELILYDILGHRLKPSYTINKSMGSIKIELFRASMQKGIYFIEVRLNDYSTYKCKLVVN